MTSLGKDWHRPCLRCEKCNKTLSSGGHAEVRVFPFKLVEELFFEILLLSELEYLYGIQRIPNRKFILLASVQGLSLRQIENARSYVICLIKLIAAHCLQRTDDELCLV